MSKNTEHTEQEQAQEELTAYDIIDAILSLSDNEKSKLPALVRTDTDGIKAYTCFLFGACVNDTDDELPKDEAPDPDIANPKTKTDTNG